MKPTRTHIAAGGTIVALGALAAVAIGSAAPGDPAKAVSVPTTQPVEVRTVVVHRTIRVVRHEKPKKPKAAAAPPAPAASPQPIQVAPAAQPAYHPVSTPPAPVPAKPKPLKTSSSGSGRSGEHEDGEHEGGGDD